jgi:hypothetical protein
MAPWCNKKLIGLRAKTRKLFNIAKRTGQWDTYKETLTNYNKRNKESQMILIWRYCQINNVQSSARLTKIMAKQATNKVSTVKLPDGQHTQT